jgi:hypothetical protein
VLVVTVLTVKAPIPLPVKKVQGFKPITQIIYFIKT